MLVTLGTSFPDKPLRTLTIAVNPTSILVVPGTHPFPRVVLPYLPCFIPMTRDTQVTTTQLLVLPPYPFRVIKTEAVVLILLRNPSIPILILEVEATPDFPVENFPLGWRLKE